jgi:hypothetical protein
VKQAEENRQNRQRRNSMRVYRIGESWTWDARGGDVSGLYFTTEEDAERDFDTWAENAERYGR